MKRINIYLLIIITSLLFSSCVDNNETPPPVVDFVPGTIVTVQEVKALYAEQLAIDDYTQRTPVEITDDWAIYGIITASDKVDGNLYKEAYIQDASGGLRLLFNATSGLYIGDSVIVNLQGMYIGDYGDFWQVGGRPYHEADGDIRVSGMSTDTQVLKTSVDNPTYPDILTIAQADNEAWLGKLVTLKDVQFSDYSLTWAEDPDEASATNRDLTDCNSDNIIVRTSGYALFADKQLPSGNGTMTGIITAYNGTTQFVVRNYNEVYMTGMRCGVTPLGDPVETLSEDFESFSANQTILVDGWQNFPQTGSRVWQAKYYSSNTYAQATAYNSGVSSMITWLITNPVTISSQKVLTFRSAMAYWEHTGTNVPMELLFSTDYDGANLLTATWVSLDATLATSANSNYAWVSSGNVYLPVEAGKSGVIAFRYTGSDTESTTFIIDDVSVTAAK